MQRSKGAPSGPVRSGDALVSILEMHHTKPQRTAGPNAFQKPQTAAKMNGKNRARGRVRVSNDRVTARGKKWTHLDCCRA